MIGNVDEFVAKVLKTGNSSLMVIIPQKVCEFSGIEEGQIVKLWVKKKEDKEQEKDES